MRNLLDERTYVCDPAPASLMGLAGMGQLHALIVEDERQATEVLRFLLHEQSYEVSVCPSVVEADRMLKDGLRPDIAFIRSASAVGCQTSPLPRLKELAPWLPVVAVSACGDARWVIEAVRSGASDALLEPFDPTELSSLLQLHVNRPVLQNTHSCEEIAVSSNHSLVFCSHAMQKIVAQSAMIARYDLPVLIMGESGTGKEVIAQYIHKVSNCAGRPFLKVNCAAMPSDLLESELLGYEQGAFTGATKAKPGKFELCNNGTIFLDEIGEMPAGLQAKLLQVLQDGTFSRLGGRTTVKVNVRVIAATNIDIKSAIAQKRFREDLYYRLNGYSISIPPLRERREEIAVLLKYFVTALSAKYARRPVTVSEALVTACTNWTWPGNVRELENFVKRFLVLDDEQMMLEELTPYGSSTRADTAQTMTDVSYTDGLKHMVKCLKGEAEAHAISTALHRNEWKHKQTAAELKISYKALLYKIRQYRINEPHAPALSTASTGTT